jgi:hypothetical protein
VLWRLGIASFLTVLDVGTKMKHASGPTLRKSHSAVAIAVTPRAQPAQSSDAGGNEKLGKINKAQESRTRNALLFLTVMGMLFIAAMVKLRHNHDIRRSQDRGRLRSKAISDRSLESNEVASLLDNSVFIHPHSLYGLSVPDIHGENVSLGRFQGMVTLIVNVACM